MRIEEQKGIYWRVHTIHLFQEVVESNPKRMGMLKQPFNIMGRILGDIANRSKELDDPELLLHCCRLTLYDIANPESEEYNPEIFSILEERIKEERKKE